MVKKKILYYGPISNVHLTKWANSLIEYFAITILYDTEDIIQMQNIDERIQLIDLKSVLDIKSTFCKCKLKKIFYYLKLRNFIKKQEYSILHLHFMESKMIFLSNLKNCVLSIWGMDLVNDQESESLISFLVKKITMKNARKIIVSSDFMLDYARKYSSKINEKIHVIKLGVDLEYFKSRQNIFTSNDINILFAKHFYVKYGADYLLSAFNELTKKHNNLKLTMLGDGPLLNDYKIKYAHLINRNILFFPGKVKHGLVREYLEKSDIFVMPSIYDSETLGVAAIEALAMGKVVIATNVGGVSEVVKDNFTGYLIKKKNSDEIVSSIEYIIKNKEESKQLAVNGRKYVEEFFNWEDCVYKLDKIYQEIINLWKK